MDGGMCFLPLNDLCNNSHFIYSDPRLLQLYVGFYLSNFSTYLFTLPGVFRFLNQHYLHELLCRLRVR